MSARLTRRATLAGGVALVPAAAMASSPGAPRRIGAKPDVDAVYDAMKLLHAAEDEAVVVMVERHGMDLGAVARMLAAVHDAFGRPEPA